jgi:NADH:ubiquinone reductase (H+-translocating)
MVSQDRRHQVVIVGGGFAGLFAARALRSAPADVTLIDRAPNHVFQPLLYQCATGILSEGKIAFPLRSLLARHRNVEYELADVADFDVQRQIVKAVRPNGEPVELPYDDLIVAAGVQQSYFGHDEFAQFAPGMKTISDALAIRRRVFGAFEMAESATDPAERQAWLTFALVGAGPTGVELAGQIRELATVTLRSEYRHIEPEDARVLLFDGGEKPLAAFGPKLSARAAQALTDLGVEQHMGSLVTHVDRGWLEVRDKDGTQTRYDAGTVLWTAGVAAPPVAEALANATGAERDKAGRIAVGDDLTIPGHPEISVVGDMMTLRDLPGVAEVAMQTGLYAGRRIRHRLAEDGWRKPFRYYDLGSAAYISRGNAVVSAGPVHLSGLPGWVAWLFIHLGFLTGIRNRLGAVVTWWPAFVRDLRRERAYLARDFDMVHSVYDRGRLAAAGKTPRPRTEAQPGQDPAPGTPAKPGKPARGGGRLRDRLPAAPEPALQPQPACADQDQQDDVEQQLQRGSARLRPASVGQREADVRGGGDRGDGDEHADERAGPRLGQGHDPDHAGHDRHQDGEQIRRVDQVGHRPHAMGV